MPTCSPDAICCSALPSGVSLNFEPLCSVKEAVAFLIGFARCLASAPDGIASRSLNVPADTEQVPWELVAAVELASCISEVCKGSNNSPAVVPTFLATGEEWLAFVSPGGFVSESDGGVVLA